MAFKNLGTVVYTDRTEGEIWWNESTNEIVVKDKPKKSVLSRLMQILSFQKED